MIPQERECHGLRRREGGTEHPRVRGGGGPLHSAGAGSVALFDGNRWGTMIAEKFNGSILCVIKM